MKTFKEFIACVDALVTLDRCVCDHEDRLTKNKKVSNFIPVKEAAQVRVVSSPSNHSP